MLSQIECKYIIILRNKCSTFQRDVRIIKEYIYLCKCVMYSWYYGIRYLAHLLHIIFQFRFPSIFLYLCKEQLSDLADYRQSLSTTCKYGNLRQAIDGQKYQTDQSRLIQINLDKITQTGNFYIACLILDLQSGFNFPGCDYEHT